MTHKTIWMCEVMYSTVVMPYKNKMSSSSASLFNSCCIFWRKFESWTRCDGQENFMVEKFQAFIYKIILKQSSCILHILFLLLYSVKDVLQRDRKVSVVSFLMPREVTKWWTYTSTHTYGSSGYYSTTQHLFKLFCTCGWSTHEWTWKQYKKKSFKRPELQVKSAPLEQKRC